jgi:tetratricopeptide (TPR) repeat protein
MTRRLLVSVVAVVACALATDACAHAASPRPQESQPAPHGTVNTNSGRIQLGVSSAPPPAAPNKTASATDEASTVAEADRLLANGKVDEAQARYQEIAQRNPASIPAQVGMIRTLSMQQKFDEAQSAADTALALHPQSAELYLALGDLQFASGKIPDAERSYVKAENLKPGDPTAYINLARVYRAYSLLHRAYENMKRAHELAPNNVPVQLLWFNSLPQQDRVAALQVFLAKPGLTPQTIKPLQQYLTFLKKNADAPAHPCQLVSNVKETETKLYAIARGGSQLGASGLAVKVNKEELHLALDTGGSGILLGRAAAERLGLQRLAYHPIFGVGDQGTQGGYTAAADRIRIGDLEFSDCTVRVTDKATPVTGQDGLIGSDVFGAYLIDIDTPGGKLRLSPLPKRPDEAAAPTALKTMSRDSQELETEDSPATSGGKPGSPATTNLPKDAYVAPDMAKWTKVYRFRNLLLVPTKVDNTGPLLFLMDTGSFNNVLSTQTAKQLSQVHTDPSTHITGLSGAVGNVYRADKATLQFGRYEQENQDVVTFDLTSMTRQTGTLVSGILGYNMLRILQVKIDYRDGLVDFVFDPNHIPKQIEMKRK